MRRLNAIALVALALVAAGCTAYQWTSNVPRSARSVSVPVLRNESDVTELGTVMTRQLLREFQREGTFRIGTVGDTALEVQGVIVGARGGTTDYDRRSGLRKFGGIFRVQVDISVVDKRSGTVIMDNRRFVASTPFAMEQDRVTALRDASGRVADELSRQVVDAMLNLKYEGGDHE